MVDPREVVYRLWELEEVIYENRSWSLVCGRFEGYPAVGIRWNGNGTDKKGFPVSSGQDPVWFVLPPELADSVREVALVLKASDDLDTARDLIEKAITLYGKGNCLAAILAVAQTEKTLKGIVHARKHQARWDEALGFEQDPTPEKVAQVEAMMQDGATSFVQKLRDAPRPVIDSSEAACFIVRSIDAYLTAGGDDTDAMREFKGKHPTPFKD